MRRTAWWSPGLGLACWLTGLGVCAAQPQTGAVSQRFPPDAQSRGMGDAFTALAEGPAAAWWNPAALATGPELAVAPFGYSKLLPHLADDVSMYSFSAAGRRSAFGAGFNLNYLNYGEGDAIPGSTAYHETTMHLAGGIDFLRLWMPAEQRFGLSAGASLKRMTDNDFAALLSTGGEASATAWDMDLGVLGAVRLPFGAGADSLRPSAFVARAGSVWVNALDSELQHADRSVPVGQSVRSGLALGVDLFDKLTYGYVLRLRAASDLTAFTGQASARTDETNFGVEATLFELVSVRTGYVDRPDFTPAYSGGDVKGSSIGFGFGRDFPEALGLRTFGFQFDWAQIPQAEGLDDPKHYSFSVHGAF